MRNFILSIVMMISVSVMPGTPALSGEINAKKTEMKELLPQKIGIFRSDSKDEFYDRQTSFRYMDGAAELYRSFGFKLLMVRRYLRADHPPIIVELFNMGSSEDAFGVFSFETEGEELQVGQGSDYGGGLLRFWKGKFFVNVYAEQEASFTRQEVIKIGKAISESIGQEGQKPKLIHYLPGEGLAERNIRYFHFYESLNYHYFVSHENILGLGKRTNAVFASYLFPQTKEKTFFLLIQYPTKKLAEGALQSFVKAYLPESTTAQAIQTDNRKWTTAQSHRKYVMVVFDAPDKEKAEKLIQAAQKKLGEKDSSLRPEHHVVQGFARNNSYARKGNA